MFETALTISIVLACVAIGFVIFGGVSGSSAVIRFEQKLPKRLTKYYLSIINGEL